ncbi:MAG: hypothetical protein ABSF25_18240 [Bryobacteraceae bacterium]|jgi:hypothetical protein
MRRSQVSTDAVVRDLEQRTLAALPCALSRLVYLASTRDYNTGLYRHDGLAQAFSVDAAQEALARCHDAVFRGFTLESLAEVVRDLQTYLRSAEENQVRMLDAWDRLEAYRVLVPAMSGGIERQLFVSNVKIALEIVRATLAELGSLGERPRP